MSKKRRERVQEQKQQKQKQQNLIVGGGLAVALLIIAGLIFVNQQGGIGSIAFRDIHGISFSADGELYVATHDGLRAYKGGWNVPDVPVNDYMGYSGTEDGFYSSGHPGPTSGLINPLGLVRSTDFGATVARLGFMGESDFHTMAASYRAEAVYVFNPAPNSQLDAGMYYTLDDGQTWQASAASGLSAQPGVFAVHPDNASTIAAVTRSGVYLSNDNGASFQTISNNPASAAAFDTDDGSTLYLGYQDLTVYNTEDGTTETRDVPSLSADEVIIYIAISPVDGQIAIATSERDVYITDGDSWKQVVTGGSSS